MENDFKFDAVKQFITFNKRVKDSNGGSMTISVNIPELSNEDLVTEVKHTCKVMTAALKILNNNTNRVNVALAATVGTQKSVSKNDAARQFDKGYALLVKLNNEIVIRDLSKEVSKIVQETLGRTAGVESSFDDNELLMLT